jgi:hypothetical protein
MQTVSLVDHPAFAAAVREERTGALVDAFEVCRLVVADGEDGPFGEVFWRAQRAVNFGGADVFIVSGRVRRIVDPEGRIC